MQNVLDEKKKKEKIVTVGNPKLDIVNFMLDRNLKKKNLLALLEDFRA